MIALDLPGLRLLADARLGDLDPRLRRAAARRSATRSASATAPSSATRWAASSPPRRRSPSPSRFEQLGARLRRRRLQRAAAPRADRGRRADDRRRHPARVQARRRALVPPPARPRRWPSAGSFDHPRARCARSCSGSSSTAACARESFVEALSSLAGYDFLDRLEEVEVPTLIVWGRHDHVVPPADAARLRSSGSQASRLEVFDRLRPRADGRAPGPLQPACWRGSWSRAEPRRVSEVAVADARWRLIAVAAGLVDDQQPDGDGDRDQGRQGRDLERQRDRRHQQQRQAGALAR